MLNDDVCYRYYIYQRFMSALKHSHTMTFGVLIILLITVNHPLLVVVLTPSTNESFSILLPTKELVIITMIGRGVKSVTPFIFPMCTVATIAFPVFRINPFVLMITIIVPSIFISTSSVMMMEIAARRKIRTII